ncbi:MAG: inorganic triphosphatase [Litorivicinaceae bacterium]
MNSPVTPDPIERELKLGVRHLSADRLDSLLAQLDIEQVVRLPEQRLGNTYFDTPTGALHALGVAVRLRQVDDQIEMTVKVREPDESGLTQRQEWNLPVTTHALDWSALQATPLAPSVQELLAPAHLRPVFQNVLWRTDWRIQDQGLALTISLDRGEVSVGSATSPVSEVELEWHQGSLERLVSLGMTLADHIPAYMAVISKAERGERLIRGQSPLADPLPQTPLGWVNRLSRMLDPLAGPSPEAAVHALRASGASCADEWGKRLMAGDIPVGLGRWMIETQQEHSRHGCA